MSGSASLSLEQAVLGHTLAFAPMTAPTQVFVALCLTGTPPSESVRGIEVSGLGYYRTPATFALATAPTNMAANVAAIEFPMALAAWGTVGYFELWDAKTGGNRLYWGQLIDHTSGVPATLTVVSGDIVRFSPGTLAVQAASGVGGVSSSPWLPTGGGTMTGPLTLAGNATLPLHAVPLQQVNAVATGISVKNYGAKGDGTTNDTAAINAAIAAAAVPLAAPYWSPVLSGAVYFPAGAYVVSGIDLPCGVSLIGAGQLQTFIGLANNVNRSVIRVLEDPASNPVPWTNRNRGRISGITIDGNSSTQTGTSHGIEIVSSSYPLSTRYGSSADIDNLSVINTLTDGIFVGTNRNYGSLTNVRIDYAGGNGIEFFACFDWIATGVAIGISGLNGFQMYQCAGFQFENIGTWMNKNSGMVINQCSGQLHFTNVQLDSNQYGGLYYNPGTGPFATNAQVAFTNFQVKDNSLAADNTYDGIYLANFGGPGSTVLLSNVWFNWTAGSPNRCRYLINTATPTGLVKVANLGYSTTAGTTAGSAPYATAAFSQPAQIFGTATMNKPTVAGAWAGNTAGKALSTALAAMGLITDTTTA